MLDSAEGLDELEQAKTRVGSVVKSKWRLDALLGCGGMAAVYRATHRNGHEVAIKMLHPHLSVSREVRDRFLREGYAANKVKHDSAVRVQDDDVTDDGAAFLVMELLEGETLEARRMRLGGKCPADDVLRQAETLLDVLIVAHAQGIVHRDLKPENLFLTEEGELKVLDFGIARIRELSNASTATQTGSLLGTPAYMAPEQARGRWNDVDHQTDIWAVGATMFSLLSGSAVHEAETASETLALAVTQPARPLRSIAPQIEPKIAEIVDRALRYDKRERWPTADSMRDAIRAVLAQTPTFAEADTGVSEISQISQVSAVGAVSAVSARGAVPQAPLIEQTTLTPGGLELSAPPAEPITQTGARPRPLISQKTLIAAIVGSASAIGFVLLIVIVLAMRGPSASENAAQPSAAASEVVLAPAVDPPVAAQPPPSETTTTPPPTSASAPPAPSASVPAAKAPRKWQPVKPTPKTQPTAPNPWDIRGKK